METLKVRVRGVAPLLLHNGRLANPLDPLSRQLKAISSKRNKTDKDFEEMAKLEFLGSWYWEASKGYIIPGHNIESCLLEGAKRNRAGRQVLGGAAIVVDPPLVFDGSDRSPEELWEGGRHALMVSVRVQRNRVMRTRAMVPDWVVELEVQYRPDVVQRAVLLRALEVAGLEVGLGDWRPRFGRFIPEVL